MHSAGGNLLFIEDRCVHIICNGYMAFIIIAVLFISISAVDVWPQCVVTAQSTSYLFLTCHPSLKESVIPALMFSELNANMKVRLDFK